jgi:hypothetical protein
MTRQRNDVADYKAELVRRAPEFGLDRAVVEALEHPVLVRVLDDLNSNAPRSELVAGVRRYNEGLTQALSPRARAVAEARTLSPATLESLGELLAGAGDASLRDVLRESPRAVIQILERDGIVTPQNRSQWVQGNGLTDEAKDRVEGLFLGKVVGTGERLQAAALSTLAKVERATPYLVRVAGVNPELDEIEHVQLALDLLADAAAHGMTVDETTRQLTIGTQAERDPVVVRIATMLEGLGQRAVGERFKAWAAQAARDPRQATMFGKPPTRAEAEEVLLAGIRAPNPGGLPVTHAQYVDSASDVVKTLEFDERNRSGAWPAVKDLYLRTGTGALLIFGKLHGGDSRSNLHVARLELSADGARYWIDGKEQPKLAREIAEKLSRGRQSNPKGKGGKLPPPTEASRALALALVHRWKRQAAHQAVDNERRIEELERTVARQGAEHTAQAWRLAKGIAKRMKIEARA